MATHSAAASTSATAPDIPVRKIGSGDLRIALRQGWEDFSAMRGDLIFVGLLYPLIGIAAAVMTTSAPLLPLFFPVAAGVGLLGPLAAVGFYELARRREAGLTSNWSHFLDVRKRPAWDDIGIVAGLLLVIFGMWLVAAGALYVLFWGYSAPAQLSGIAWYEPYSIGDFVTRLFTTPEGWALIVVGNVVGLIFAALVLAISVVSLPMLVDRDVSASRAVSTSWRAARANPGTLAQWGLIVLGLLILGSIPLFIGLALVLPWLGYSTWHLYTRLVDRNAVRG
ncbi:DUF2189 domain-containing protein [Sphingomonas lutea]|uniref:DUF2189 domain-containing protein n=1 Tax=Sphingomonas lutea TaxID=1045317 RepID=A0A7G9SFA1_9SPHN|nr:DUF2189 domain-containing protein [Sphingomonas lutea]QNN66526.1 DUF2189 domain-containing protein [Sphingomonas lutea]